MNKNTLVIVSGLPGVGKTTLAKKISDEFNLPIVSMDAIKEKMWDTMGYEFELGFVDKIGKTVFELVYHDLNGFLSKGVSLVVEANFSPEINNERINELKVKYGTRLLQIYCDCEAETLRKRFKERMKKDSYHKGHKYGISLYGESEVLSRLGVKNKRLDIDGETYDLDTTIPETIDYEKLFAFIKEKR